MKSKPFISKSKYLAGIQCDRLLWTYYNAKDDIPGPDDATQALFDHGHEVGEFAKKYFPNGRDIEWDLRKPELVIEATKPLLVKRVPLFEAGLEFGRGYARFDVLNPALKDKWDLIEVKSGTSVKEVHWIDVSLQKFILEKCGLKINDCFIMVLNNEYVKQGKIDVKQLFKLVNVNEKIESLMPLVQDKLNQMLKIIELKKRPEAKIGPHCNECKTWYECPLKDDCWSFLPDHNVFELNRLGKKGFDLLSEGIQSIKDIPPGYKLSDKQNIQKDAVINGAKHVDKAAIKSFLGTLKYPIHYFDFETINPAIPLYDGMKPYQHVPFQFSLHIQEEDGSVKHHEYLHNNKDDPRPKLLEEMKKSFKDSGSIVVYYQSFEKGKLMELAEAYPKYKEWVDSILERFVDLYEPFSKFFYYDAKQKGSAGLKATMPSLTGKGYEDLEIGDGGAAMRAYEKITFKEINKGEKAKIRKNMLKYCGQDTEGMIWMIDKLKGL